MTGRIILYGPKVAPFTEKVRRGLLLKKLEFEVREPESPEDYRRWSPETGLLPVLEIDGERVADSTDILLYLDACFPEPPLLSSDPVVAAQQRQLEDWADESFLYYFLRWFRRPEGGGPPIESLRDGEGEGAPRSPGALSRAGRRVLAWLRTGGTWERPETAILRSVGDRLTDLVNLLGARPFFYSERVSMADLAVYGMLYSMRIGAIPAAERMIAERPALVEFMRRVEAETGH